MNEFIKKLLEDGVVMTICMVDGNIQYNLETGMKGDCYATDIGNGILRLEGRYGWKEDYDVNESTYESFIRHVFDNCDFGRGFCSIYWSNLLRKYKILG